MICASYRESKRDTDKKEGKNMVVSIDFETRSAVDLRKTGVYKYASDQSTDIWCMAYKAPWSDDVQV